MKRTKIVEMLQNRLEKIFADQNFNHHKQHHNDPLAKAFPLGVYKRFRDKGGFDLVDIQFDKNGKNSFVVNFGVIETSSIVTPWGDRIAAENITPSELPEYYRLFKSSFFWQWFPANNENQLEKTMSLVESNIMSIFEWFSNGSGLPKNAKKMSIWNSSQEESRNEN